MPGPGEQHLVRIGDRDLAAIDDEHLWFHVLKSRRGMAGEQPDGSEPLIGREGLERSPCNVCNRPAS